METHRFTISLSEEKLALNTLKLVSSVQNKVCHMGIVPCDFISPFGKLIAMGSMHYSKDNLHFALFDLKIRNIR